MKLVLILILAFRFPFVCSSPEGVPSDIQIRATCWSISWFDKVASPQGSLTSHPLASLPRGQQRQKKLANHLSKLKVKRRVSRFLDFVKSLPAFGCSGAMANKSRWPPAAAAAAASCWFQTPQQRLEKNSLLFVNVFLPPTFHSHIIWNVWLVNFDGKQIQPVSPADKRGLLKRLETLVGFSPLFSISLFLNFLNLL